MVSTDSTGPCVICQEALMPVHQSMCQSCAGIFHIRMTENVVVKECGSVWLDDEDMHLIFMCFQCQKEQGVGPMSLM